MFFSARLLYNFVDMCMYSLSMSISKQKVKSLILCHVNENNRFAKRVGMT